MVFKRFWRAGMATALVLAMQGPAFAETLKQALEYAYANNPNIMSALLSVKASAEDIAARKAGKLPTIGFSADATNAWSIGTESGFNNNVNFSGGFSYRHVLWDNYRTDAQIEQARALTEVATYAMRNQEQNVLLSVAQAYMNVIRDTQLVNLRAENMRFFQAQLDSAGERLRIGEGTRIDVSQSQARLAQATASYRVAIGNLQISQASYERWVGRKPSNLVADFNFNGLVPTALEPAIRSAESRHPAVLSAQASIRVSQAGFEAARAAFGPTLTLIGSLCTINCFGNSQTNPGQAGVSGTVGLQLNIPIYSGGANGAAMRKANILQIQSEFDALSTRDQVRESVTTAWATLQNANAQIQSARTAVESQRLVVEGVVAERDVGQSTTLDVLNAQAELTSAQESLIGATATRTIASFSLIAATGRLNARDLRLNVQIKSAAGYIAQVEQIWSDFEFIE
jgi:outer membrane protein